MCGAGVLCECFYPLLFFVLFILVILMDMAKKNYYFFRQSLSSTNKTLSGLGVCLTHLN